MANTNKILYSNTAGNVPSSLANGQIAIQQADGVIYYRNGSGAVTQLPVGSSGGTSTAGDTSFASVSLLLHFDGNLTDSSGTPKAVTAVGGAAATGSSKYGSASLALDGDGDGLTISDGLPRDTEDFTVELWVLKSSAWTGESSHRILFEWADNSLSGGISCYLNYVANQLRVGRYGQGDWYMTYDANNFSSNTWYHIAVTRSGSTMTLWVNGSPAVTSSYSGGFGSNSGLQSIGIGSYMGTYSSGSSWPGRIDEFRATRGVCRYSGASFTAPTEAFPNSASSTSSSAVTSVAGRTGAVVIVASDIATGTFDAARIPTHKATHATGGADALTASDIGAAASSHTHAAGDIVSGTIDPARLGSGASATTFLRGDSTYQTVTNGTSAGVRYLFSTTTTSGDPGSGYYRLNASPTSAVTAIYMSATDADGNGRSGVFSLFSSSTDPTNKGVLTFANIAGAAPAQFAVTGTPTNNTTWYSIPVSYVSGGAVPSNGASYYWTFARTGNAGSNASATTSASDLTSGTIASARLPAANQSAAALYLWANFR